MWKRILAMGLLMTPPVLAVHADGLGVYANYIYSDEAEHGIGPGVKYTLQRMEAVRFDARLSWIAYGKPDLDMIPLEANVAWNLPTEGGWVPYLGLGVGYYFINANRGAADDSLGWQILGGMETEATETLDFFVELRWLWLDADVDNVFAANEGTGNTITLDGFGVNLGLLYHF